MTTKLVCPDCQHENEPERIYCHACGARLDRSAMAKIEQKKEDPQSAHRRLKSMLDPQRARGRQLSVRAIKFLVGAGLLAAVVTMLLPADVPPKQKFAMLASSVGMDLENATLSHRAGTLQYNEEQVNSYLASALKSKQANLSKMLQFDRALVSFGEGTVRVTQQRSLLGYSLYAARDYGASQREGALAIADHGGSIGRLPIHPAIMQLVDGFLFSDLWAALERDRKSLAKLSAVDFHAQQVVLTAK